MGTNTINNNQKLNTMNTNTKHNIILASFLPLEAVCKVVCFMLTIAYILTHVIPAWVKGQLEQFEPSQEAKAIARYSVRWGFNDEDNWFFITNIVKRGILHI
jgi:hypothetical protein